MKGPGEDHPYEALAAFADGSATDEQRRTARGHLHGCRRCTEDLALARAGTGVLRGLPPLEAPGLAGDILRRAGATEPGPGRVVDLGSRPRRRTVRWERLGAAVGVAAAIVAGALFLTRTHGIRHATSGALRAPAPPAGGEARPQPQPSVPPLMVTNAAYDQQTLEALAKRLAASTAPGFDAVLPAPAPSAAGQSSSKLAGGGTPRSTGTGPAGQDAQDALACVERSAGLPASTPVLRLEAASYQGSPVFVGAFRTGPARDRLLLVAATRSGCRPLQVVSQRI